MKTSSTMKEVTYGWYPSVRDIYRPKGRPSTRHLDRLHNSDAYRGYPIIPQPELFLRGVSSLPPTPPSTSSLRQPRCRSAPAPPLYSTSRVQIPTPTQCWTKCQTLAETHWGVTVDTSPGSPSSLASWPLPQDCHHTANIGREDFMGQHTPPGKEDKRQDQQAGEPPPGSQRNLQETLEISNMKGATTSADLRTPEPSSPEDEKSPPTRTSSSLTSPPTRSSSSRAKQRPSSSPVKRESRCCECPGEPASPTTPGETREFVRSARAQSARPFVSPGSAPVNHRPVSCVTNRHSSPAVQPVAPAVANKDQSTPETQNETRSSTAGSLPSSECGAKVASRLPSPDQQLDYDRLVHLYSWRAQIPGDPYRLKKPMARLPYFVKCSAPALLPEGPKIHIENNETFFHNTIPRRPLSFSVDKEWVSEVLLAKRLELQKKQGGIKYNFKKFAFVY